jgi:hypothetical protein
MDEIEIRVEKRDLGIGPKPCVDIRVNDHSLSVLVTAADVRQGGYDTSKMSLHELQDLERLGKYAGLPPEEVFRPATRFLDDPAAWGQEDGDDGVRRTFILRCRCGDDRCSYVVAKIRLLDDRVVWSEIAGSDPHVRYGLPTFTFDRGHYLAALGWTAEESPPTRSGP